MSSIFQGLRDYHQHLIDRFHKDPYSLDQTERMIVATLKANQSDGKLKNDWAFYIAMQDPAKGKFKEYDPENPPAIVFDIPEKYKETI
jgi:hypothetical protein